MCSVEQLLIQNLQPNKTTIIHSHLGRKPSIILYYMTKYFNNWKVLYRPFDEEEYIPHDVLIWFEPPFNSVIKKYPKCMIVFTSHSYLQHEEQIIPFQLQNVMYESLLTKLDDQLDDFTDVVIKPTVFRNTTFVEIYKPSTVCIDLTHCKNIYVFYLCFLNAIENLQYYEDFILKWKLSKNAISLFKFFITVGDKKQNAYFKLFTDMFKILNTKYKT